MHPLVRCLPILLVSASLCGVGRAAEPVLVSSAISLQDALLKLTAPAAGPVIRARCNFGSSGQLMQQIKEGAPVDVFISAAAEQVDELIDEGFADADTRTVIARNTLVLIIPADADPSRQITRFEDLANASVRRIAIGQPRTVPAGEYAAETLRSLKVLDAVKDKLVYGAHVRQVLDYVERGEVDAGIVYQSDFLQARGKVRRVAMAEAAWHQPIEYVAVVVSRSGRKAEARGLIRRLLEPAPQKILSAYGFSPATQPATRPASAPATRSASGGGA